MKVIDLQLYRIKRAKEALEKKIGQYALEAHPGAVRDIKTCFSEWLKISNSR